MTLQMSDLKEFERKSNKDSSSQKPTDVVLKPFYPKYRAVAFLQRLPFSPTEPSVQKNSSVQSVMTFSKQLMIHFVNFLSAQVTYVVPLDLMDKSDESLLPSIIKKPQFAKAKAVIMFGHQDDKIEALKSKLSPFDILIINKDDQAITPTSHDLYPNNFSEKQFPKFSSKTQVFNIIKEINHFLNIEVKVTGGGSGIDFLSLKCDPFQWSLFQAFLRDRISFISKELCDKPSAKNFLLEGLFTPPDKFNLTSSTVPPPVPVRNSNPTSSPSPSTRHKKSEAEIEVGSPEWFARNELANRGSRPRSQLDGPPGLDGRPTSQTPALDRSTSNGGGAREPSTSTGPSSGSAKSKTAGSGLQSCPCCMDDSFTPDQWKPFKCGHGVCAECEKGLLKANTYKCPMCNAPFKKAQGIQPKNGTMTVKEDSYTRLPGFENDRYCRGAIIITYYFPSGTQGEEHPHPGQRYTGTSRMAYLPNNPEGQKVLRLLKKAWDARLVFTIGTSVTTGQDDCVIWNNIHHKTSVHGGSTGFGYPDPTYLARVTDELKGFGITE